MEGPAALREGEGLYAWHSGAPVDDAFEAGYAEITGRLSKRFGELGLDPLYTEVIETCPGCRPVCRLWLACV
jgi:hypothetical protein